MANDLVIQDLHVEVEGKEILRGIDLTISKGEIHAVMGPNGSGKSTLANTLAGHPKYTVTQGDIRYKGESILKWGADERAQKGLFLAFQYPMAIPGVTVANFLRMAVNAKRRTNSKNGASKPIAIPEFRKLVLQKMETLKLDPSFATRYLNDGFSGGEKKRVEILQMAVLNPEIAILDETDSGLDIDAVRIVSEGVNALAGSNLGILVITHYQRILNYIKPNFVHVLVNGKMAISGGPELSLQLEDKGYDWIKEEVSSGK
ncbi:MAG: Fe-S cluster assembly ATPase SufC [Chloroflexi bacterium]|nr:Fe-S cluster assembly ATPase SufC [Chloroflexota bacterium]MBI3742578.1 Fe-S cluster assembly ATPase SufC [Chloroflexota bacterium]